MAVWQPTDHELALLRHVIKTNGVRHQEIKAAEEYSEASAAISRFSNRYCPLDDLAAELADTQIMLVQLCEMYPELAEAISRQRVIKLATTAMRFNFTEKITGEST